LKEATMKKMLNGALAAFTLGAALAGSALPASADEHHDRGGRGWEHRGGEHYGYGYDGSAALLGLALGATLGGYAPGYYAYPPPYYAVPRCRIEMRWNPYWGGYDRVRVCY
jgi:hypothetical protein